MCVCVPLTLRCQSERIFPPPSVPPSTYHHPSLNNHHREAGRLPTGSPSSLQSSKAHKRWSTSSVKNSRKAQERLKASKSQNRFQVATTSLANKKVATVEAELTKSTGKNQHLKLPFESLGEKKVLHRTTFTMKVSRKRVLPTHLNNMTIVDIVDCITVVYR